jgi:hypothetical protein
MFLFGMRAQFQKLGFTYDEEPTADELVEETAH